MDSAVYIRRVLDAYRATPGACGVVRKPDRAFALALHARGVPLEAVERVLPRTTVAAVDQKNIAKLIPYM